MDNSSAVTCRPLPYLLLAVNFSRTLFRSLLGSFFIIICGFDWWCRHGSVYLCGDAALNGNGISLFDDLSSWYEGDGGCPNSCCGFGLPGILSALIIWILKSGWRIAGVCVGFVVATRFEEVANVDFDLGWSCSLQDERLSSMTLMGSIGDFKY